MHFKDPRLAVILHSMKHTTQHTAWSSMATLMQTDLELPKNLLPNLLCSSTTVTFFFIFLASHASYSHCVLISTLKLVTMYSLPVNQHLLSNIPCYRTATFDIIHHSQHRCRRAGERFYSPITQLVIGTASPVEKNNNIFETSDVLVTIIIFRSELH